jgi:hypothetical protein
MESKNTDKMASAKKIAEKDSTKAILKYRSVF